MSHSGTMLVLRNSGPVTCTVPAQPTPAFTDAKNQPLNIIAQDSPASDHSSTPSIELAPGASVTSDMRWVSGNVYDNGHCESSAYITLAIGSQKISTAFAGHLCGTGGEPSAYTLTSFKVAEAPAKAAKAANSMTYVCADGRTIQAMYPDTNTAVLTLDEQTHRLHVAVSADGARYVGDQWQWWTKGMHDAQLATLKPGEKIASSNGVTCTAP